MLKIQPNTGAKIQIMSICCTRRIKFMERISLFKIAFRVVFGCFFLVAFMQTKNTLSQYSTQSKPLTSKSIISKPFEVQV